MDLRDLLSGLFWLVISGFVCLESARLGTGTLNYPGAGFIPFWSGVILGILAILVIVRGGLKRKGERRITDLWTGVSWGKVIWILFSLFLYCLLLPTMGYIITTFGLMVFLLSIMDRSKAWIVAVSASIIISVSYLGFHILLDARLPKGVFGF
jgi:putative tricarboxylic transport membrane protein